jgi:hypothetical protein
MAIKTKVARRESTTEKTKKSGYASVFPTLEIKTRIFILSGNRTPLRYMIPVKHSNTKPLTFFDGTMNRALRWATNQISPFVDEQDGLATVQPIIFENGKLVVEPNDVNLIKFLYLHPGFNVMFFEFDAEKKAGEEVKNLTSSLDAQVAAKELDISDLEAIARVVSKGTNISNMTSSELRRDMIIYARNNSKEFLDLLSDENLKLRNLAVRSVEEGLLKIKSDGRTVVWADDKGEKILVTPYGENVYSAMAMYFKTDVGLDVMQNIVNKL